MSIVDSRSKPLVLEVGEYLFIRLWRWDEERLVRDAEDDFYKKSASGNPPPYYSISVFALQREEGECVDDLVDRLVTQTQKRRRSKFYTLVTEREMRAAGFDWVPAPPPPDHFDVPLGESMAAARFSDLAVTFGNDEKIRMPA